MARALLIAALVVTSVVGELQAKQGELQAKQAAKILLQRSRSAGKTEGAAPGIVQFPNQKQPTPTGHFLTNSELGPITAISCLKAKQANPAVVCENSTVALPEGGYSGLVADINAGNYPNYADAVCNSYGEYFCDPNGVLTPEQGVNLAMQLKKLRESNVVTCGGTLNDKVDPLHYQPFYLGVVIAKGWPTSQSDPDSLQQFGQIVAAQWHMDNLYVGGAAPYARCPNTAVLVILPDQHQAYLSSASCEFLCASRGGPEVATAAIVALDKGGAAAAALAGVETVYKAVATIPQRSGVPVVSVRSSADLVAERKSTVTLPVYNFILRVLFGIAIVLLVISLAIGLLVLFISPGVLAKSRRK